MASPWPLQEQGGLGQYAANDNPSTYSSKQSRARRRRQYVIHTGIYHRSMTGARVRSALRNLNLCPPPPSRAQSLHFVAEIQGEEMATAAAI